MGTGHGGNKDPCSLVTDRPCEGLQPLFPQEDFSLEVLCYFFFFLLITGTVRNFMQTY